MKTSEKTEQQSEIQYRRQKFAVKSERVTAKTHGSFAKWLEAGTVEFSWTTNGWQWTSASFTPSERKAIIAELQKYD